MKEEKRNKREVLPENEQKKVKKINPQHQQEQEELLFEADAKSPVNRIIDTDEIQFLSGNVRTWKELVEAHLKLEKFINDKIRDWEPTFPEEIYRQWRRLNRWDMDSKSRPMLFAYYTVRDIYGSLPREIYSTLDYLNEYIYPGASIRIYRYCQLLTKECHEEVRNIIQTVVKLATSSNDIYEYRLKLAKVYGEPFSKTVHQMDMFRDNNDIINSI